MIANMKYQKIIKYLVSAVCVQPLHIGSASGDKEEVLVHPTDNVPFIQASSISGVLREYYAKTHDEQQVDKLFGSRRFEAQSNSSEGASRVRFSDGSFCGDKPILELRPRVKINPVTGTCDNSVIKGTNRQAGHKFNMEYIGAGAVFEFSIYLYDESFQNALEELLAAVSQGDVQLGGQKSNGCGFMELQEVQRKLFDMTKQDDRCKWTNEETLAESDYEKILKKILSSMKKIEKAAMAYDITVTGSTEGELLVKSIAVSDCGKNAPDSMNIRNAAKDYIVPGSSLKGAVRGQMEKIAAYIGKEQLIEDTFGGVEKAGNIIFYDTIVGNRKDNDMAKIKNRIHIDKFTGGVMHGGLFNEKNVSGKLAFHIAISDRNNPAGTCGLLLMVLRDMALGVMSVGGGYNVGKGIIDIDSIVVLDHKNRNEAVISVKDSTVKDENGIVARCLRAVRSKEATI